MQDNLSLRIDMIKGFAIVFVIYIHSWGHFNLSGFGEYSSFFISQVISRTAVPLFFVISAYLLATSFENKRFDFRSRLKKLSKIYLLWNSFAVIIFIFGSLYFEVSEKNQYSDMSFLDLTFAYLGIDRLPPNYPLWFLRDLILLTVIFPILYRLVALKSILVGGGVIVSLAIWLFDDSSGVYQTSSQSLFFFLLGLLLHRFGFKDKRFSTVWKHGLFFYLACGFMVTYLNLGFGLSNFSILNKTIVIVGVLVLLIIPFECKIPLWFSKFGKYSLVIYVLHEPLTTLILKTTDLFEGLFGFLIFPFLLSGGLLLFGATLEKYFPYVYKKTLG